MFLNYSVGLFNTLIASFSTGIWMFWVLGNPYSGNLLGVISSEILQWILGFLILDLYIFSWHRWLMHTRIGWWVHKFHHQDLTLNSSSAFRFHPVEVFLSQLPRIGLVWIFGISLEIFIVYEIIFLVLNVIQHSNIRLPDWIDRVLSKIVITPNLHKVHHSNIVKETNSNYGTVLSLWDGLLGSRIYRKDVEKIKFGF